MDAFLSLIDFDGELFSIIISVSRLLLPLLAIWILFRSVRSMLRERYEPEIWGYITMPDGARVPIRHWECTIGRSKSCDVVVDHPTVSRTHAALTRNDKGDWTLYDIGSKGGTTVSGNEVYTDGVDIYDGNVITLAGVHLGFISLTDEERLALSEVRTEPGRFIRPGATFLILSLFITIIAVLQCYSATDEHAVSIALAFGSLLAVMWCYYLVMRSIRRSGFEVETIAFFLSALGLSVAASSVPEDMVKQIILLSAGVVLFIILGWWLRDLDRVKKFRWPMGLAALLFLALNLLVSEELFGAKNWIYIAGFSLQPSEFIKIAYIYAGAATLDRLYIGRNLFLFIGFSAVCVLALALMSDFGTAIIFFATFLVISFMRSGNLATVILAISSAGIAGFLMLSLKPYIANRFATWGHIWELANEGGYQQTRALSAAASGGLFGVGAGRGWLHNIVASDTDMVFALISEEYGLIIGICAITAIIALAAFIVKNASNGRSSFYLIAACAAASMMMIQLGLNVFGSLDIIPFTGVTFPFVSRGGSSLISCWALLAFIKAGDTRQNASFAIKLQSPKNIYDKQFDDEYEDYDGNDYTGGEYLEDEFYEDGEVWE